MNGEYSADRVVRTNEVNDLDLVDCKYTMNCADCKDGADSVNGFKVGDNAGYAD